MARDTPPIRSDLTETIIQYGRVIDVDVDNYTVSVVTEFAMKPFTGIPFATPYQHYNNGEGIYFMPEVGSMCWICEPSDGKRPFVVGWAAASSKGDYTSGKMQLNPGDIYLGTRDANFMILRRGGVVQVGGGPLSQRLFLPVQNTIRDICENYSLQTLGGELSWSVGRTQETTDGKAPTSLVLEAREYSNDPNPVAILSIGSHGSDSSPIMDLSIRTSSEDNAEVSISVSMTKAGKVEMEIKDDFAFIGHGAYSVSVDKEMSLSSTNDMSLESKSGKVTIKSASEMSVQGGSSTTVSGVDSVSISSPNIYLGGENIAKASAVLGDALIAWLSSHTHPVPGVTVGTGSTTSAVSASPTTGITSQTVKVAP